MQQNLQYKLYISEQSKNLNTMQAILLKKFVQYTKHIAYFYISLQQNKRQLCEFLRSIDQYIIPFAHLDLDKKGVISQKDLQLFLIRHKHFYKPQQINRYFQKYVHGKANLDYDDILQALLPHSKYVLLSTVLHKNPKITNQHQICKTSQHKVIQNILALIISQQIEYLNKDYILMNDITDSSHQIGAILWRSLDRQHNNQLSYEKYKVICEDYKVQFDKNQWQALINWHFRSHKKLLRRADMMQICNIHNQNKRNRSACNYENYVMKKQQKKQCQEEHQRKIERQKKIKQKISLVSQLSVNKSTLNRIIAQQQFPSMILQHKVVLGGKLGYQKPQKCIKYSQIVSC